MVVQDSLRITVSDPRPYHSSFAFFLASAAAERFLAAAFDAFVAISLCFSALQRTFTRSCMKRESMEAYVAMNLCSATFAVLMGLFLVAARYAYLRERK